MIPIDMIDVHFHWHVPPPGVQASGGKWETFVYDDRVRRDFYLAERYGVTCWVMSPDWKPYIKIPERILT